MYVTLYRLQEMWFVEDAQFVLEFESKDEAIKYIEYDAPFEYAYGSKQQALDDLRNDAENEELHELT
ncbi:hypothetical protein pwc_18 [Weissella phage PWc]|nr:hypothetical protein pwc_18 [Weissella phage PWc]